MKTFLILSCIFIITLLTSSYTFSQTTAHIRLGTSTGQDALVLTNYPDENFNGHPDYLVSIWTSGGDEYVARVYFQFYLNSIPPDATIQNAKLSLYANPDPVNQLHSQLGGSNLSYIYRVQTPWDENTVTWNTQPDYSTLHKITIPPTSNQNQDYPELDVTDMVRDMVKNPEESHGFMMVTNTEWFFWYRAMNFAPSTVADTSKRPLLRITFDKPLPVELLSFTSEIANRNLTLKWETATEENNSGFEVQRSSDNVTSEFEKIGFIDGNGNSSTPVRYSFEDRNLNSGLYKYRLKQIDYNGNFKFYDLQNNVTIGIPEKYSLSQNYPNPFNPATKINYDLPGDGNVAISLYDITGKEIKKLVNEFKSAGFYSLDLNAKDLSSGTYFYRINAGDYRESKSMILIK